MMLMMIVEVPVAITWYSSISRAMMIDTCTDQPITQGYYMLKYRLITEHEPNYSSNGSYTTYTSSSHSSSPTVTEIEVAHSSSPVAADAADA